MQQQQQQHSSQQRAQSAGSAEQGSKPLSKHACQCKFPSSQPTRNIDENLQTNNSPSMKTRLLLPPVKAATVQFPPSCPVVFFRSSVECATSTCDTEKSSCAGNGGDDEHEGIINPNVQRHGTAVGLGIVRSVSIDLSPESDRQLFYSIEILTKRNRRHKHNKDMPPSADSISSTSASSSGTEDASALTIDEPETIQVPEWSLRYAPNCPALVDLSCFNNEDDDYDAQQRPSTIVSTEVTRTTTASSVAKGIILCGLPTLSEDEDGVTFVYSALVHHTDGDQFYEVHDIPLHAIRFDPTNREVSSTEKTSSTSTTFAATTTGNTTSTYDDDVNSPSFACEENNLEDPTDPIDATSSHKDEKDKEPKVIGKGIEHTFNDPMAIQPSTNGGPDAKSSKESSSTASTSRRSSAKSSRRNRDDTPSPSKKSRSERSSEKKERRKKEKDRRERSSSLRRSRRRDRRSRSRSRDRKSRSSRSRKHSYGSSSSRSRSRSLDHQRSRRSFSYDRYERRGRSPGRGHRSFSRSRSHGRRERAHSRQDRSSDDPSIRQHSCSVPAQPLEAMRPQGNHCIIEMPSKHSEYASFHTKDTSTTTPTWTPPAQVDKSRQVAFPRWLDIDSVFRAVSKHQQAFQEGQGFFLSVGNFRTKVSLDGIMVDPDLSPADLSRALLVIKERLCQLVKDDGAYHRLLYDLAVFDNEKTGHYDGGPVYVVDPLAKGASRYTDHQRPWRMIIDIPYSKKDGSFHSKFVIGEKGSRVLELERQFGCQIKVFSLQHGRHTLSMCRPYISIKSAQKQNVARATEEIRAIIRQHQINCACSLQM